MPAKDKYHEAVKNALVKTGDYTMERINIFRKVIKTILTHYTQRNQQKPDTYIPIFDDKQDCYSVIYLGWRGYERVADCVMLIRIKKNKIWIEQNNTDLNIDSALNEAGISKKEIVNGLLPLEQQIYSEYAVE